MTRRYRITPRAHRDLKNIGRYSMNKWGKEQRNRYLRALDQRFAWLVDRPHVGKHRPDINQGFYSFPQGSHLIFYLIHENGIDIIGILHKKMDISNYFGEEWD
ncbi:MAG: type II toxin-antitoxin system RelE/ParE family toxin [Nitrospirota bacterium]|nr:type II toxin-antitoxin system RelE/ParE family toxin [Nitrospirota bacterium]